MTLQKASFWKHAASAAMLATAASTASAIPISGQGTWETTLQARDLNTDGIVDAYYDTVLDISWLADANYAGTLGLRSLSWAQYGQLYKEEANVFVAGLDIHGVTGWRHTTAGNEQPDYCSPSYCSLQPTPGDSELAHLYYVTLGNSYNPNSPINTGGFSNVATDLYLTGSQMTWPVGYPTSIQFDFGSGTKYAIREMSPDYTWAVHDGDVGLLAPVPEPETYAMMLMGLAGVGAWARRRKAKQG